MKTKTKKCGKFRERGTLALLAAVLLVSAVLITSCPEALDPGGLSIPKVEERQAFEPPPGMGFIVLNVDVEKFTARTAMPDVSVYDALNKFGKLEVYISEGDGTYTNTAPAWDGLPASTFTVNRHATAYKVTVLGYDTTSTNAVAAGSDTIVVDSANETISIILKEITSAASLTGTSVSMSNGTLSLSLTNPGTVTTADISITGLTAGTTGGLTTPVTVLPVSSLSPISLAPGYYRLTLALEKQYHQSVTYNEIIVIWAGLTTTYTRAMNLVSNRHEITYTFNDERDPSESPNPSETETKYFTHATNFTHPTSGAPDYLDETNTVDSTITFEGWYDGPPDSNGVPTGALWSLVSPIKTVIKPAILYAKWIFPGPSTLTVSPVTIEFSPGKTITVIASLTEGGDAITSPLTYAQASLGTVFFRIGTTTGLTSPTYVWKYAGDATQTALPNVTNGVDTSISINFSTGDYSLALPAPGAPHTFNVEITDGGSVVGNYEFTVYITR